jgi:hypothetical protein
MVIRFSPYNSPFVPHGDNSGIYWIGREFRDMPHNAHVYEFVREQGRRHVEALNLEMNSAVAILPLLDEMAADGVAAAGRRARDIRKFLSPSKNFSYRACDLRAKKLVKAQV